MSVINTHSQAIAGARNLSHSQEMLGRSTTRLSSGSKIASPSDDVAGLALAEKLDAQGNRVKAATTNVQNAVSHTQTADGFMSGMTSILSRMSELGTFAKDVTKVSTDVESYQREFSALQDQLRATIGGATSEIGGTTGVPAPLGAFNGTALFGANSTGLTVKIGHEVGQNLTINETNLRSGAMLEMINQDSTGAYTLASTDSDAIQKITASIDHVASERATLGAAQSHLELAAATLQVESGNLSSAIARIRDTDVAAESTQYAKYNILVQSGTAMLAQANQTPQSVLKLLHR